MSNSDTGQQGWRLVGEIIQPLNGQDEQRMVVWLVGVLEGIEGLSAYLERVADAVVAAVKRAGGRRTTLASLGQPLTVRVLIPNTFEAGIAPRGWGFFLFERANNGMDGTQTESNREGQHIGHCVELYLYTDGP